MSLFASKKLVALYTDIGRGHPNYMDSTLRAMRINRANPPDDIAVTSVFDLSHGLSLMAWKTVRKIYRKGAQGGMISSLYNRVRTRSSAQSGKNRSALILGKDIRRALGGFSGIVLVAHPILVQILGDICRVFYIHGEIATPSEFDLSKAEKIFVPLKDSAQKIIARSIPREKIAITGLMIEPELIPHAESIRDNRIERLSGSGVPVIAFYNSGAYPKEHVIQILRAAEYILGENLGRAILSTGCDRKMNESFKSKLEQFKPVTDIESFKNGESKLLLQFNPDREKLTMREIELLPMADLAVMAAHERINWTVGLGIPVILLEPDYGGFAPQNRKFAECEGTLFPYKKNRIKSSIDNFLIARKEKNPILITKRSKFDINGSFRAAEIIQNALAMDGR